MEQVQQTPEMSSERIRALDLEILGLRDALVGANTRAATAEWRLDLAENRIKSMTKAVRHRNEMLNSLTWKVGRVVLWPLSPLRYVLKRLQPSKAK
jgi:hypothetical protein